MKYILIKEGQIEYTIIKSRRKTMGLIVDRDSKVTVRAPYAVSKDVIERFITENSSWIVKKQQEMKRKKMEELVRPKRSYADGSTILFEGAEYPLHVAADTGKHTMCFEFQTEGLFITMPYYDPSIIKEAIERWYKNAARIKLTERCVYFGRFISKPYGTIRIKSQKGRWGSCSSKGNLNFNWKLILMPPCILDYVVVHELCHLEEMNHSKAFWSKVGKILPEYENLRKWLKEHGSEAEL